MCAQPDDLFREVCELGAERAGRHASDRARLHDRHGIRGYARDVILLARPCCRLLPAASFLVGTMRPAPHPRHRMVPHLKTALSGPLLDLERRILERMPDIERWLRTQWQEHAVPFYASVDLRNAGFKLAPVDTNLFPGGFNNLNPAFLPLCVQAIQAAVERVCPDARGVLLCPRTTRATPFYLQNVATLEGILRQAGHARAHRHADSRDHARRRASSCPTGERAHARADRAHAAGASASHDFDPCMVLLNNDLSAGPPPILQRHRPADRAAAVRRLVQPAQVASLRGVSRAWPSEFADAARHRPVAGRSVFRRLRRDRISRSAAGEECLAANVESLLDADPAQVRRIRHRREAVRHRQGRCRHLRHGHHDGARSVATSSGSTASSATRWRW